MQNYRPFAGADDALSRLLSGQSGATIGKKEMLATAQDTIVNPLKLSINQLLEEQTPNIQQAASASGTRFSSRVGNVLGDLLQDANRQATTVIGSELGRLEQTRLLANQAAQLQAEGLQVQGLGLARDRENQAFNRNAAALQNEEMFRQLRQQRIQSTLPHFNPFIGTALQFSTAPTQQYVQSSGGGGIGGAIGGFLGGSVLGNEFEEGSFLNKYSGWLGAFGGALPIGF